MNRDNHNMVKEVGFSLLAEGKTIRIRADGYSMYPAIKPGSVIYIEPVSDDQYPAPGEVISWKRDTGFVVHRLKRITCEDVKTYFITRGDSCAYEDRPVLKDQVAGKVVRVENVPGKRTISGYQLIRKPNYLYNRLLVWFVIRLKKVLNRG
jgi:signal peptidase I